LSDYLGPLVIGTSGTYTLQKFNVTESDSGLTAAISVLVNSTTSDLLATAVDALAAQARQGNTYVHSQPGVTSPVVYTITKCEAFTLSSLPGDPETAWQVFRQLVDLTLTLESRPAGALTTLYNAQAVNAPDALTLSALLGTHPPKLDVTIDDASGNDMHSVWAALAPTALTDAKWLVLASALTWTTCSNGTGATMWGNTSRYTTSASWQTAPLDTSLYPAGKYRLLVRASQEAGTGYVMDSQNQVALPITRTTQHLQVIGDVDLPVQNTAYGVASNLTLYVRSDGTNDCIVNAFVLLPLDLGYFFWHPDVATTEIDQLDVGPNGTFMDGVTDLTYLKGGTLEPKVLAAQAGTLVATASPSGSTWPTDWGRTDSTYVTADTSRIKCVGASKYAWYAVTNSSTPLVVPGEWYELSFTRRVSFYVAGNVTAQIVWQDIDGNTIRLDTLSSVAADDASPTAVTVYGMAPAHAARAQVKLGTDGTGNVTVYWSAVSFRRCPLRLIVVSEDAAGALSSYVHPVTLTVVYTTKYETARGIEVSDDPELASLGLINATKLAPSTDSGWEDYDA